MNNRRHFIKRGALFLPTIFIPRLIRAQSLFDPAWVAALQPTQTDTLLNGLVGRWNFEEGSGTSAADSSGNSNTGTLTNGPSWVAGRIGSSALSFDGVNDYVTIPRSSSLDIVGDKFTVSAWVKSSGSAVDGFSNSIISRDTSSTAGSRVFLIQHNSADSKISFFVWNTSDTMSTAATTNAALNDNAWHHLVARYNGAATELFLDGTLQTTAGTLTGNLKTSGSLAVLFGSDNSLAANRYFSGSLDYILLHNRDLNSGEIATLAAM